VASLAVKVFDGLTRQRSAVIAGLNQDIQKNNFNAVRGRIC
jgi:hypothetical protein